MKHDWRRRGAINDTHSPMVTGQIIYSWLLIRHVLYISMIYLSLLIHILAATRIHIKKGKSKKHLPTSLFVWNAFVYRAFHEGGVWQRGHSTPHLTPPSFYSASTLCHFQKSDEDEKTREKVTCWVRCWVRCLANTSLSEPPVNKGVSEGKVRWGGLFWNSPQKSECSTRRGTYCPMGYMPIKRKKCVVTIK